VGWYFFYQGTVFQVVSIEPSTGAVSTVEQITRSSHTFHQTDLFVGDETDSILFAPSRDQLQAEIERHQPLAYAVIDDMGLPDPFLAKADFIIAIVNRIEDQVDHFSHQALQRGERPSHTDLLRHVLQLPDIPIGLTTYYKYRRLYQQYSGNRAHLAASLRRSTYNQLRMSPTQLHFMDTLIQTEYLRPAPVSKSQLYRLAGAILQRTGGYWVNPRSSVAIPVSLVTDLLDPDIPMTAIWANAEYQPLLTPIVLPSQRWFYNYIKHFESQPDTGEDLLAARYGHSVWDHSHNIYDTFIAQAAAPLQYVFADHWQVDVLILDDQDLPVRLWLTFLIDAFSRCILGMALLPDTPCIESIQQALLHSIWPKQSHHTWGLTDEWVCYGIPQHLSLDNAWAHHSHSLENLARSISLNGQYNAMTLVFRPPYRGRYGAVIERLFGTFADQVKQFLPGVIHAGQPQSYANAVKTACLRYDDLYRFLHELVLHYQHSPHRGLHGMTPHAKWLEGLQLGLPLVPRLTPAIARLFWRMDPQPRIITAQGICAFGMHYTSLTLNQAPRMDHAGKNVRYTIRYNPDHIEQLALFCEGQWLGDVYAKELRLPDGTVQPLSLAERKIAQQLARQVQQPVRDWLYFTRFWQQLSEARQTEQRQPAVPDRDVSLVISSEDYDTHYTTLVRRFAQR
jgi:hypothetical protein